jgi:autotransporter translocation and assembly factor TamB
LTKKDADIDLSKTAATSDGAENVAPDASPEDAIIEKKKRKIRRFNRHKSEKHMVRWHLLQALGSANAFLMFIILICVGGLALIRFGTATDSGRAGIEHALNGLKLGPVGKLYVKGLHGDLLTDFNADYLMIKDEKGVWLDASGIKIAWAPADLAIGKVHIEDANINRLNIYRRPILTKEPESKKDLPVAIAIDKLAAVVISHKEFSTREGVLGVGTSFYLKRNKDIQIYAQMINARRRNDRVDVDFATRKSLPIRANIRATEQGGGPISGMLGLDANVPLFIKAQLEGDKSLGVITLFAQNGGSRIADVRGNWDKDNGGFSGFINFNSSEYTREFNKKFGGAVNVNSNWSHLAGANEDEHSFTLDVRGPDTNINASGKINYEMRKTIGALDVVLTTRQMRNLLNTIFVNAGVGGLIGKAQGSIDNFRIWGPVSARDYSLLDNHFARVNGNLDITFQKGKLVVDVAFHGLGNSGSNIIARIVGNEVTGGVNVVHNREGQVYVDSLTVNGRGVKMASNGGVRLGGATYLAGKAMIDAPNLTGGVLNGNLEGNFEALHAKDSENTTLTIDAIGRNLKGKGDFINEVLGTAPRARAVVNLGDAVYFTAFNVKTKDIEANATNFDRNNLFGVIGGDLKAGNDTLKLFKLSGSLAGKFSLSGLTNIHGDDGFAMLNLNLNAAKFSSKITKLDEYIGMTPNVRGKVLIGLKRVLADELVLTGKDANIALSGQLVGMGDFSLKTQWKLNRPIYFGPVEASGNLYGNGLIVGPYDNFKGSFTSNLSRIDIGGSVISPAVVTAEFMSGQKPFVTSLKLNGKSDFGDIIGNAQLLGVDNGFAVRNIDINGAGVRALGSASFIENQNPSANFAISVKKGLFLQNGALQGNVKIEQNGKNTYANVNFQGQKFTFRGTNLAFDNLLVNGAGDLQNLTLDTSFSLRSYQVLSFNGKTFISSGKGDTLVRLSGGGHIGAKNYNLSEPLQIRFGNNEKYASGKINFIGKDAAENSMIAFDAQQKGDGLKVSADVEKLSISAINQDFVGTFSGTMRMHNANNHIEGTVDGKLNDARARGLNKNMAISGDIHAGLENERLSIKTHAYNNEGLNANSDISVAAVTSVSPLRLAIARNEPLGGNFTIDGEIRPLADLFLAGQRYLSGKFKGQGNISGTINDPIVDGDFALSNGKYREPELGLTLNDLNLNGTIDSQKLDIVNFTAKDGRHGEIKGEGQVGLRGNSERSFHINTHKFRLVDNDIAVIDATGDTVLEHIDNRQSRLSGQLRIDFAEFSPRSLSGSKVTSLDVEEINVPSELIKTQYENGKAIAKPKPISVNNNILLDVKLSAARGVFIRGRGLNLELSVDAGINGTLQKPQINGTAKVFRGEYEYGGRAFEFEDRGTIILDEKPENIRLNLSAKRETTNLNAYINIGGTAQKPEITLTSTPSLPADEVLAQVLFGRSKSQLSSFEAVQLASSLAALAGGGGFDVMANLREFARLDRLVFGNTTDGEISIAGGKYLGRDVYLEVISQGTKGVDTSVEWRPFTSTAIVSTIGTMGDAKLSIRWRKDFK